MTRRLISQQIDHFNSGISQQPPAIRSPEQLEEQINCMSSETNGLVKRPPTIYKRLLGDISLKNRKPLIHSINRDGSEQYLVVADGDSIQVIDTKGNKRVVNNALDDYIKTGNPRRDLRMLTIADHTFILSKNVAVRMAGRSPDVWASQGLLVHIKEGHYGRTYSVNVNGANLASWTAPDGGEASHALQISTTNIANQLAGQIRGKGYSVSTGNSWLYIENVPNCSYGIDDGLDNSSAMGIQKNVHSFNDLPATAPNGFLCRIQGDVTSGSDDYYVRYDEGQHLWVETCHPNIETRIDPGSMPRLLVSNADGTFTLKTASWDDRVVGDDESNPIPSFVGKPLADIFLFRNRLGVIAGDACIMSESASYFNFWMSTATNVLDTDAIDIPVSHPSIIKLRHAVVFNSALVLLSDNVQFMLTTTEILTPKNATISVISEYTCSPNVRPIMAGKRLYYAAERDMHSMVRELFAVGTIDDAKLTNDISSHVPNFIPNTVYGITANNTENILLMLTDGAEDSVYIYKYLFAEERRVQAAWSVWKFNGSRIIGGDVFENKYIFIIERNGKLYLEELHFPLHTDDLANEPYRIYLDRKQTITSTVKQIDIPALYGIDRGVFMSSNTSWGLVDSDKKYVEIKPSDTKDGVYEIKTEFKAPLFIGEIFECKAVLSTIYLRQRQEENKAVTTGRLQLRYMTFNYADSGLFDVSVGDNKYIMSGKVMGSSLVGRMELQTGNFRCPIQSNSANVSVTLRSNNPIPFNIINASWEGIYYDRSTRY